MLHYGVTDVEAAPDLHDGLARTRAALAAPPHLDGLTEDQQAAMLEIRDTAAAMLGIFDTIRSVPGLAVVPALPHICAYHLALCGWRRTGAHDPNSRALLHADLDHPTGADGGVLDLTWIPAARDAIAAVLAGAGWQLDPSRRRIKLRAGELPMWLPVTAPDTAPAVDAPRPWSVTPAITIDPDFEEQWTATEA
jgi:hypothetical protein